MQMGRFFVLTFTATMRRPMITNRKYFFKSMQPLTFMNAPHFGVMSCVRELSSGEKAATQAARSWNVPLLYKETQKQLSKQATKTAKVEYKYSKACEMNEDDISLSLKLEALENAQEKLDMLSNLEADLAELGDNGKVVVFFCLQNKINSPPFSNKKFMLFCCFFVFVFL
jgi:hypothetical protein